MYSCQGNFFPTELYNDINLYQGHWVRCDSTNFDESIVEHLTINNASVSYCLYDSNTDFVIEKQEGMVLLGNNNKMEWNTVSELNNLQSRTYWTVKDVQNNSLWLFSNILGDRVYQKDSSLESPIDTMGSFNCIINYHNMLPLSHNDLKDCYYAIDMNNGIKFLLNNPLCSSVTFNKNEVEDSIRSYSFSTANISTPYNDLLKRMTFIHEHDGISDYCDAQSLEASSYVISTDDEKGIATISVVNGYDYWINMSQYLNTSIDAVKQKFSDVAYSYSSKGYQGTLPTYKFVPNGKYGYRYITFAIDNDGSVIDIKAEFPKSFINVNSCLFMLNQKYVYDRTVNGEYIYYNSKNPRYKLAYNSSLRIMHYYLIEF